MIVLPRHTPTLHRPWRPHHHSGQVLAVIMQEPLLSDLCKIWCVLYKGSTQSP